MNTSGPLAADIGGRRKMKTKAKMPKMPMGKMPKGMPMMGKPAMPKKAKKGRGRAY